MKPIIEAAVSGRERSVLVVVFQDCEHITDKRERSRKPAKMMLSVARLTVGDRGFSPTRSHEADSKMLLLVLM